MESFGLQISNETHQTQSVRIVTNPKTQQLECQHECSYCPTKFCSIAHIQKTAGGLQYLKKRHSAAQGTKSHAPMATDRSYQDNIQWSPSRWLLDNLCNWLDLWPIRNAYPGGTYTIHCEYQVRILGNLLDVWMKQTGCMNETNHMHYTHCNLILISSISRIL